MRHKLHEDEGEVQFRRALSSLGIGMIYTGKRQAQAKGKVEKIFDYFQPRLPYLCEKHSVKDCFEAQKILDELVSYYNQQRIHEETREIPANRWQETINNGKAKLRPLESSVDLERIFSIHLQRKARKDGSIMFMGRKWFIKCPEGTSVTVCLIPNLKFMIYKDENYGSFTYEWTSPCPQIASYMCRNDFYVTAKLRADNPNRDTLGIRNRLNFVNKTLLLFRIIS